MQKRVHSLLVLFVLCGLSLFGDFTLDKVFTSNMVLQQEAPIAFFGKGTPGSSIKASFMGKEASASIGQDGQWRVAFPAAKADHVNYTATFSDGTRTVQLADLLLGDVWFCSGQSNMELPIGAKFHRGASAQNCEEEVKNSNHPELRYAYQLKASSFNKYAEASLKWGTWVKSEPQYAPSFSATAYFFGRQLQQDLNIPIGLIVSSWGGTSITPWISKEGYEMAQLHPELDKIKTYDLSPDEIKKMEAARREEFSKAALAWYAAMKEKHPQFTTVKDDWAKTGLDTAGWSKALNYNRNAYSVRWYRCLFKVDTKLGEGLYLTLMSPGAGCDVWLNGKRLGGFGIDKMNPNSNVLYLAMPEELLKRQEENLLVVRAELPGAQFSGSHGNNTARILIRDKKGDSQKLSKDWLIKDEISINCAKAGVPAFPPLPDVSYKSAYFYCSLYNGAVAAWTRLPIKGVIWYQGCSNNGSSRYFHFHKALINDWRSKWNNPKLPFLIVQLAGYANRVKQDWTQCNPSAVQGYAMTRDIQLQMTKIPFVGLATAVDIGERFNIHPANKQDVGLRLALEAERIAYGKNIVSHGPKFTRAVPEGNAIRVFFENADGLHTTNGKAPAGFAVAGEDKKFVWAEAKIDGSCVVVSSPSVPSPKYVRYAFVNFCQDLNLQNGSKLPAYPFRSDEATY